MTDPEATPDSVKSKLTHYPTPGSAYDPLPDAAGLSPKLCQGLGHFVAMAGGVHLLEHARDAPCGIDDERRPRDPHALDAEGVLLHPHTVRLRDGVVLVHQERHGQAVLLAELPVRVRGVRTHPQYHGIESLEPREGVPERARLDGSTGGIVLGIEEQHHPASAQR